MSPRNLLLGKGFAVGRRFIGQYNNHLRLSNCRREMGGGVMVRFGCPNCKTVLEAAPAQAGAVVACPKCRQQLRVPRAAAPPASSASPPAQASPPVLNKPAVTEKPPSKPEVVLPPEPP